MNTRIFREEKDIPEAAEVIRSGGLLGVPTETVYGLCVNGLDADAVHRLYEVKGRPEVKALVLMVSGASEMEKYCHHIPRAAYTLAEDFWPGPLTVILPSRDLVPSITRAGGETVGLRCPAHPMTLSLLKELGLPMAGPSANPSGAPSAVSAEEVLGYFDGKIDAVLDGGHAGFGQPSTILDMSVTPYRILRQGALSEEDINRSLRRSMTVVGITGGTGCGKTTALKALQEQGALLLDCDGIYHGLLKSDPCMLQAIEERFSGSVREGILDRKALGSRVFGDPAALEALSSITHPFVIAEAERRLTDFALRGGTLAAIDAIALFESGLSRLCTCTVAVTAPEEDRIVRLIARDGISREYAQKRIRAQHPEEYYVNHCDSVIHNSGTFEEFKNKCREQLRFPEQGGNIHG